jgi:CheY-like chemotaxis protein
MTGAPPVLLVEDDRFLRRACATSLRQRGFPVVEATNGEEGLRLVRDTSPALVLLDMLMPKMNGLEFLKALRADAATAAVPVIILSNSSKANDLDEARRLGILGYFVKADLSLREVGDLVAQVLERRQ